jgi:hypothetical protein
MRNDRLKHSSSEVDKCSHVTGRAYLREHRGHEVSRASSLASGVQQHGFHESSKSSKYWTPLCLKESSGERDIVPPLPVGKCTALFFPDGQWHGPHVKSAVLVVTRMQ